MKHIVRGRLAGASAALLLLASIGSPIALGRSSASSPANEAATASSPFTLVGTRAGQRYATGTAGAARTLQARSARDGLSRRTSVSVHAGAQPGAAPAVIPPPVLATQTTAPDNHVAGFAGLAASDQASATAEPANSTIAAGPDEIVQMANLAMRITNRAGSPVGLQLTVPQFFLVTTGFFDREPRVIYDSLHGRFVATEVTWDCITGDIGDPASFGHGYIDLAVSRSTDPNGLWDRYFWSYNDLVPLDASLGSSTDKLAISNNLSAMTHGDGGLGNGSCGDLSSLTTYAGDILIASWADAIGHKASTLPENEFGTGPPAAVFGIRAAVQAPATSSTL